MKKNNEKLWGGRFQQKSHPLFQKFNSSLNIDYRLAEQDIIGSIAWSKSLLECNILNIKEQKKIEDALKDLLCVVEKDPKIMLSSTAEDIHSWVESQLIKKVGVLGKKIHTGRSRNDQVATDLKLWCKNIIQNIITHLKKLQCTCVLYAENSCYDIMPGYTHLQKAQPITFAYWCLAYIEMFKRDESRLRDLLKRINYSPLGSGALSGTFCNIDRDKLAINLGFEFCTENGLDSVSDRDYVVELLSIASISMMHLSRLAEDLIFFNSEEANFIELSDCITSGSSLMPQKKNPDALELIRGKTGLVYGYLLSMLVLLKGLPLSYNKDMQEDKNILFSSIDIWIECLKITRLVFQSMKVNRVVCLESAKTGYSNATELADYLVNKGLTFRESHDIIGNIIIEAIQRKSSLLDFKLVDFKKYSELFENDLYDKLSLSSCINSKKSKGGVAFEQVLRIIHKLKQELLCE